VDWRGLAAAIRLPTFLCVQWTLNLDEHKP
jgi:hypothetical protein